MKTAENYQFPKVSLDEFIAMDNKANHSMESKTTDDMENYVSLQEMVFGLREMVHSHFSISLS